MSSVSISASPAAQHLTGVNAQAITPGLYVVATPIGNLRDITLRALDVLAGVDGILAEDTRQTTKLLDAYDLSKPLTSYHDHNAASSIPKIMQRLAAGEALALVSDAGTPLVSDPGFKLVRAAIAEGHEVIPLPGASAPLAALVKSGLPSDAFHFAGFLPAKSAGRKTALQQLSTVQASLIFFETGPRIKAMLSDVLSVFGERDAAICRELTKHYEQARRGSLAELMTSVTDDPPRGEIVVVIAPPDGDVIWDEATVIKALTEAIPEFGVKRAATEIAQNSGWKKRDVYQLALSLS